MVGLGRLELPTSPLSGVRSNHLSYRPIASMQGYAQCCALPCPIGARCSQSTKTILLSMTEMEEKRRRRHAAMFLLSLTYWIKSIWCNLMLEKLTKSIN